LLVVWLLPELQLMLVLVLQKERQQALEPLARPSGPPLSFAS
jgi:hypothetical protein